MNTRIICIALTTVAALANVSLYAHDRHEHRPAATHTHGGTTHTHKHEPGHDDITEHSVREHLVRFRSTGDERHLDRAWTALAPTLDTTRDATVLVDAATVAQAQHHFDAALNLVDRAIALAPFDRQAWLLKASIDLVGARTDDAAAACAELRNVATIVQLTCNARVDIAAGRSEPALRTLSAVLDVVDRDAIDPGVIAWTLSVAGDAAAELAPSQAAAFYRESLALGESTQVRAALVDVLLAMDDVAGAHEELSAAGGGLALDVRRLIVAVRDNQTVAVIDDIDRLDRQFRRWIGQGDYAHAREMARFYLDVVYQPELAQQLAVQNYNIQRETEDLRLVARTRG